MSPVRRVAHWNGGGSVFVVILILSGCYGQVHAPSQAIPRRNDGNAKASPTERGATVHSPLEFADKRGKRIQIRGTARNTKLSAALEVAGVYVGVPELPAWRDHVVGNEVVVSGTLEERDYGDGIGEMPAARPFGKQWVVVDWKLEYP